MSRGQARTKTRDQVLVDEVYESPVDTFVYRTRRRIFWFFVFIAALLLVLSVVRRMTEDTPVDYASDVEHFKYGSIGAEPGGSLLNAVGGVLPPYEIFRVLPDICPEQLPGGFAELGFISEPGRDLPIGISKRRRLGVDQVGLNCASCHTGTVREAPGAPARVVLGMGANRLDVQKLTSFLLQCTLDPRFTPDNVLAAMERSGTDLDTFNPYKALQFNWPLASLPPAELNGASDFPSLWNQAPRDGMQLHWDGNNPSVAERNLSASLGAGVTPTTIDHERLQRVADWAWTLEPPPYPWPRRIDRSLASLGEPLYDRYCASCHAFDGQYVGTVVPLAEVGTDPYRLNSYTYTFASSQYTLYPSSEYQFKNFRKTDGYANHPLDGVWARAPYLHNGSVPTLRDLLEAPEDRPDRFYRGNDVFDHGRVGFVSTVPTANGLEFTVYDTSLPGNGNGGHLWGTQLSDDQKAALVEYMKTL
jgi:mono/diheme cytochrome c family protein